MVNNGKSWLIYVNMGVSIVTWCNVGTPSSLVHFMENPNPKWMMRYPGTLMTQEPPRWWEIVGMFKSIHASNWVLQSTHPPKLEETEKQPWISGRIHGFAGSAVGEVWNLGGPGFDSTVVGHPKRIMTRLLQVPSSVVRGAHQGTRQTKRNHAGPEVYVPCLNLYEYT